MIGVEEARARILAGLSPVGRESVSLAAAHRRVLAAPICARLTQPPAALSAMDGYAARAAEAPSGASLPVAGESAAGHPFAGALPAGAVVRVSTGSVLPAGADAVVPQEDTLREGERVRLTVAAQAGRHVRPAGQDFHAGETLLEAGARLTARQIGLIAAANHPWVSVYRRPVVAVLATGDELALPGEALPEGGVISSNGHALAALIGAAGGTARLLTLAADRPDAIEAALADARGADLLVTIGGASVGDHDLVQAVLGARGMALDFWKVAMRPGKPLMHGQVDGMPMLGLPGNPVSAYVCAMLFLRPALARLSGEATDGATLAQALEPARLDQALPANDARAAFLRARLTRNAAGALLAAPAPDQASSLLRVLAEAEGLIFRPPHAAATEAGGTVGVLRLDLLDP